MSEKFSVDGVDEAVFTAEELDAAFQQFEKTVAEVAVSGDWERWADQFTEDADYIEHAMGTFKGRDAIKTWICKTMRSFPGNHMVAFPSLWHVVDPSTSRVICEIDNPMRDPGDGSVIGATNITILTYAGDGLWSCEEDVYNPMKFGQASMDWCKKAQELGTLTDEAKAWMDTSGKFFR
ncbi:nuclear transport factor 2 family protein [Jongsikchunia kroppenstedtii]|uniref:nuclear transport factor 2 family protein n=1 Tax=Jongsikchunia kroppenstedtii TaxID=1121721 RepID=UPI000371B42D|nr:nuclear transport factor 2 family protein [Jongsikchunia kroppenstedtii]